MSLIVGGREQKKELAWGQQNRNYPIWTTEKIDWKNEQNLKKVYYNKRSNICVIVVPERGEK